MNVSNRSRLAVEALLDLAQRAEPLPLPLISRRLRVSVSYLEGLFAQLRRNGLVHSTRGPGGGYRLARAPSAISVRDVLVALGGSDSPAPQAPFAPPPGEAAEPGGRIHSDCFEQAERVMASWLSSVSLLDLMVQHDRHADTVAAAA